MSKFCAVKQCNSDHNVQTIKFKSKPADVHLKWKQLCGYGKDEQLSCNRICIRHFEPHNFQNRSKSYAKYLELKEKVNPTLNLPSANCDE